MNVMGLNNNPRPIRDPVAEAEFKRLAEEHIRANPDRFPVSFARLQREEANEVHSYPSVHNDVQRAGTQSGADN